MGTSDKKTLNTDELKAIISKSMGTDNIEFVGRNKPSKNIYRGKIVITKLWGIYHKEYNPIRIIDEEGIIKLQLNDGRVLAANVASLDSNINKAMDELTIYGDAGAILPDIFIVCSGKIIDLTGLINKEQIISR